MARRAALAVAVGVVLLWGARGSAGRAVAARIAPSLSTATLCLDDEADAGDGNAIAPVAAAQEPAPAEVVDPDWPGGAAAGGDIPPVRAVLQRIREPKTTS